jgi:hypothetical protein
MSLTIASYGGGTNSTAMLIEMVKRGEKVDLILFADTGAEKPHTYEYVKRFNAWLYSNGMPEITVVHPTKTIEDDCVTRSALPSVAYGFKTCSERFKLDAQRKYCNNWPPAKSEWKAGNKVMRIIGFDADEPQRAETPIPEKEIKKYTNRYPLIEWDMGRDECIETIQEAGLCLPGKSACYFCPNSKPSEIRQLAAMYPDLASKALAIEAAADLTAVKGLGRTWSWGSLLATDDMFDDDFATTPEMLCGCYDG